MSCGRTGTTLVAMLLLGCSGQTEVGAGAGGAAGTTSTGSAGAAGVGGAGGTFGVGGGAGCEVALPSSFQKENREVGVCPAFTGLCQSGPLNEAPLFSATQLHVDARFVAATSSGVVVAERPLGDGTYETIVARAGTTDDEQPILVQVSFKTAPPEKMRARGADRAHLMLCDAADCRVYVLAGGSGELDEVPGGPPPAAVKARGLTTSIDGTNFDPGGRPCVFGDGLYCLEDGQWAERIAPGSGPRFNAATGAPTAVWLAGDEGRLVVASRTCVIEVPSGTAETLRTISADGARELWATAAGDGGVVIHASLEETTTCQVGDTSWSALHRTWGDSWGYKVAHEHDDLWLFDQNGLGIQGKPSAGGSWCTHDFAEELVDATVFQCGMAENPWVVTTTSIYGTVFCAND